MLFTFQMHSIFKYGELITIKAYLWLSLLVCGTFRKKEMSYFVDSSIIYYKPSVSTDLQCALALLPFSLAWHAECNRELLISIL